jgi:hypothetical protein
VACLYTLLVSDTRKFDINFPGKYFELLLSDLSFNMARIIVDKLLFECPICTEPMDDSWKMLACQHTLCFKCLETIYKSADSKDKTKPQCPTCRREIYVPIERLEKPLLLYDIFDKYKIGQDSEIYGERKTRYSTAIVI